MKSKSGDWDRVIVGLAESQAGVLSRAQALARGVPKSALDRRVVAGSLERVHHGVLRIAGSPRSLAQEVWGAVLAAGPGAVASHLTAAELHGLPLPVGAWPAKSRAIHISIPPGRKNTVRGVEVHRSRQLGREDTCRQNGILCTTPTRTLLDVAALPGVSTEALEGMLDHALGQRLTSRNHLLRRQRALGSRGRPGAALMTGLLRQRPDGRQRSQSAFERLLLRVLRDNGLPAPVSQHPLRLSSGRVVRLDVAYPDAKLAIEADSYAYHSSHVAWANDHVRNRDLIVDGWHIFSVTWRDLVERPLEIAELLRRTLEVCLQRPA